MINKEWHEYSEGEILQANIEKYQRDEIVKFYQDFEEPRYTYIEYQVILQSVLQSLRKRLGRPVRAVDMCGGAGKAAFVIKTLQPDSQVTLVDLSAKMLDIARQRAAKLGIKDIDIVEADAFSFLDTDQQFDLFVYSSALHHFKDPVNLLQVSAARLSPEGMIVSIADPSILITSRRYKFFQFLATNNQAKLRVIKDCFRRSPKKTESKSPDFDVAEYQTLTGINDLGFREDLKEIGLHTLLHMRYPAGEPYMTRIMPYLGLCWAFSMVISPDGEAYTEDRARMKAEIKNGLPFKLLFF